MNTNLKVKTSEAAEIAGVSYEAFRGWLKRGLLKDTGTLPKFYAANAPAKITDAKRWRWSAFGFADLCSFRLTKVLLEAGMSWGMASDIASDHDLWRSHHNDDPAKRFLAVFRASSQYTLYSAASLAADLDNEIIKSEWMILVDLQELRRDVASRAQAAPHV